MLMVQDMLGCAASDEIWIKVQNETELAVFIPNIFRPDGSVENQFFTVFAGSKVRQVNRLEVYDRWGELVFRREHFLPGIASLGWDGTWRGRLAPPGVYVYFAELELLDGRIKRLSGDVNLLR